MQWNTPAEMTSDCPLMAMAVLPAGSAGVTRGRGVSIFEINGESYRFRESAKSARPARRKKAHEA